MSKDEMQIDEAQLRRMTVEMDEMHRATFPVMREMITDVGASLRRSTKGFGGVPSRRGFLAGSGVLLGGAALAACGGGGNDDTADTGAQPTAAGTTSAPSGGGDNAGLATNASLENLAVFAYGQALMAAPKGKFGDPAKFPKAVAEFATQTMKQHADHAEAFNAALTNAGGTAFTEPNPKLAGMVTEAFGKVNSVTGLAELALMLEKIAGATYVKQMGEFTTPEALQAVATIAPVERQHAAALEYVLGNYPIPDTFVKLDVARPNDDAGV